MSNFAVYSGNFLNYADAEFRSRGYQRQRVEHGVQALDLRVACPVGIFKSQGSEVVVEVDTDSPRDFEVSRSGQVLRIVQRSQGGAVNLGSGNVVINGSGVSVVNGQVWVNGQRVSPHGPAKPPYPHKIKIHVPSGLDLDASLSGVSVLASKVIFANASVSTSGRGTVGLSAQHVDLDISGLGQNYVVCQGGRLAVDVSGQGSVIAKGSYASVSASVSGMGKISTSGACSGGYKASVSGMGSISHSGPIAGRVRKSASGMGRILLG